MATLSSLSGTWTLPVLSLCCLICYAMYCRAREATAGSTTTPFTSQGPSSRTGLGGRLRHISEYLTPRTPTTSAEQQPGSSTSSSAAAFLREAREAGPTAGGLATSPDCCLMAVREDVRAYIAQHPASRVELTVDCADHGPVLWLRRGREEAGN